MSCEISFFGVAVGVPNKQNVFHLNKPLYLLGSWASDMNDKGFTGISGQGFLRREKKTRMHLVLSVFVVHVFFFYQEKKLCKGPSGQPVFYS